MKIRGSKTLTKFIYEQMMKLDQRKISTDQARAQAGLARQANNSNRYEVDKANAIAKLKAQGIDFKGKIDFNE